MAPLVLRKTVNIFKAPEWPRGGLVGSGGGWARRGAARGNFWPFSGAAAAGGARRAPWGLSPITSTRRPPRRSFSCEPSRTASPSAQADGRGGRGVRCVDRPPPFSLSGVSRREHQRRRMPAVPPQAQQDRQADEHASAAGDGVAADLEPGVVEGAVESAGEGAGEEEQEALRKPPSPSRCCPSVCHRPTHRTLPA